MPTPLVSTVVAYLKPYVDLMGLSGEQYYFRKASTSLRDYEGNARVWHPKIENVMLRDYHLPTDGIMYAALPKIADLGKIRDEDLLFIGCSASGGSRYWRVRPYKGGKYLIGKS